MRTAVHLSAGRAKLSQSKNQTGLRAAAIRRRHPRYTSEERFKSLSSKINTVNIIFDDFGFLKNLVHSTDGLLYRLGV